MHDSKPAARAGLFYFLFGSFFVMVFGFQNCDGGFKASGQTELSLEEALPPATPTSPGGSIPTDPRTDPLVLRIKVSDENRNLVSSGATLTASNRYLLSALGFTATQTLRWQLTKNTAGCNLTTGVLSFQVSVACVTQGVFAVELIATELNGTQISASAQHAMNPVAPDYCSPLVGANPAAVFRIPLGTGTNAWNTPQAPIAVALGQTLRICNDDTTAHRLGISLNGIPCAAQTNAMTQGMYFDCLVTSTNTSGMNDSLTGAGFSVLALDGRGLFATHCQNCHGAFPGVGARNATGASGATIETFIQSNRGGMGSIRLTPDQLNAIGYALSY